MGDRGRLCASIFPDDVSLDAAKSAVNESAPMSDEQLPHEIYLELKRLAQIHLARERSGQTWQATDLVHEVYLKLHNRGTGIQVQDEKGFLSLASVAIRHILVDRARRKKSMKHGGAVTREVLIDVAVSADVQDESLLRLDEALTRLAAHEPEAAQIVQLRYFAGQSLEQAAKEMQISPRSASRLWAYAKAWLKRELCSE